MLSLSQKKEAKMLFIGAHGANRTRDTWIRNPVLYPLSYAGGTEVFFADGHHT
jgi:hypothetical protein